MRPKKINRVMHRSAGPSEQDLSRMTATQRKDFEEMMAYQSQFQPVGKEVHCLALGCENTFFSPDPKRIRFCPQHRQYSGRDVHVYRVIMG